MKDPERLFEGRSDRQHLANMIVGDYESGSYVWNVIILIQ